MNVLQKRSAAFLIAMGLALGVSTPGCQQMGEFLIKLIIHVSKEVAKSAIAHIVEKKIDEWFFAEKVPTAKITVDSTGQSGNYKGTMRISILNEATGLVETFEVTNPRFVNRSGTWVPEPSIYEDTKKMAEKFGR